MDRMWNGSLTALCCPLVDTLKYSRYFSYVVSVSFLWCSEWGRVELYEVRKLRRIKIIMWLDRLLLSDHRGRSEQRVNGEQTHLLRPQLSRLLPSDCSTSAFWLFFFYRTTNHRWEILSISSAREHIWCCVEKAGADLMCLWVTLYLHTAAKCSQSASFVSVISVCSMFVCLSHDSWNTHKVVFVPGPAQGVVVFRVQFTHWCCNCNRAYYRKEFSPTQCMKLLKI